MWEALKGRHDLGPIFVVVAIAAAITIGIAIKAWRANEAHKRDAELKLEMLSRGMSVEEIERVLCAKSIDSRLAETTVHRKK